MTEISQTSLGLAVTLVDAAALAASWGAGTRISIGQPAQDADILCLANGVMDVGALKAGRPQYVLATGNGTILAAPQNLAGLAETLIHATRTGFISVCLAAPATGRTVYQGHLFERQRMLGNLLTVFGESMESRVGLVPHDVTAAGARAIGYRLAALKEQGVALALVDAVTEAECAEVAIAFATQKLICGPAWVSRRDTAPEPEPPDGKLAIITGGVGRQTLFQLGAAATAMPVLQLDFDWPDIITHALAWAAPQPGPFIIAASTSPGKLHKTAPVPDILAGIAQGLVGSGITRLMLTGSDTAAAILSALGAENLTTGAAFGPLRWLRCKDVAFLIHPGGIGGRDLFLDHIGPQIRLNAAAE